MLVQAIQYHLRPFSSATRREVGVPFATFAIPFLAACCFTVLELYSSVDPGQVTLRRGVRALLSGRGQQRGDDPRALQLLQGVRGAAGAVRDTVPRLSSVLLVFVKCLSKGCQALVNFA